MIVAVIAVIATCLTALLVAYLVDPHVALFRIIFGWLAGPGPRRQLQHAAAAFIITFAGTFPLEVAKLSGPVDTKVILSVIGGCIAAGGVAVFRALVPPELAHALTLTELAPVSASNLGAVHIHVDTPAAAAAVAREIVATTQGTMPPASPPPS